MLWFILHSVSENRITSDVFLEVRLERVEIDERVAICAFLETVRLFEMFLRGCLSFFVRSLLFNLIILTATNYNVLYF